MSSLSIPRKKVPDEEAPSPISSPVKSHSDHEDNHSHHSGATAVDSRAHSLNEKPQKGTEDIILVSWDGPDDPENPQVCIHLFL
jgi:hypothetical protein